MAEPHVALDAKALEAAENAYAAATMGLPHHECEDCGGSGVIVTGRGENAGGDTCQACGGGGVVVDFPEGWNPMASAITAYLAALSQNPGTSNTSGEAGPVAWRWRLPPGGWHYASEKPEFAPYDAERVHGPFPMYAALEPRASDRERTIEECAKVADGVRQRLEAGRNGKPLSQIDEHTAGTGDRIAAAIRKLSEVSHV